MSELLECPCCKEKPLPCPFCGKAAKIYGESVVECSDFNCGGQIDFGHWCGVENGIPAVHFVIKQWNKRHSKKEIERQQADIERLKIYAKHRNDAEVFCESLKHSDYACTCGLQEALKHE